MSEFFEDYYIILRGNRRKFKKIIIFPYFVLIKIFRFDHWSIHTRIRHKKRVYYENKFYIAEITFSFNKHKLLN